MVLRNVADPTSRLDRMKMRISWGRSNKLVPLFGNLSICDCWAIGTVFETEEFGEESGVLRARIVPCLFDV